MNTQLVKYLYSNLYHFYNESWRPDQPSLEPAKTIHKVLKTMEAWSNAPTLEQIEAVIASTDISELFPMPPNDDLIEQRVAVKQRNGRTGYINRHDIALDYIRDHAQDGWWPGVAPVDAAIAAYLMIMYDDNALLDYITAVWDQRDYEKHTYYTDNAEDNTWWDKKSIVIEDFKFYDAYKEQQRTEQWRADWEKFKSDDDTSDDNSLLTNKEDPTET